MSRGRPRLTRSAGWGADRVLFQLRRGSPLIHWCYWMPCSNAFSLAYWMISTYLGLLVNRQRCGGGGRGGLSVRGREAGGRQESSHRPAAWLLVHYSTHRPTDRPAVGAASASSLQTQRLKNSPANTDALAACSAPYGSALVLYRLTIGLEYIYDRFYRQAVGATPACYYHTHVDEQVLVTWALPTRNHAQFVRCSDCSTNRVAA